MDITSLTAVELGKKIKAKEISVVEAVKASIAQIEKVEKDVNSFVTLDKEGALKRAEEVQKLIDDGKLTGPLAGVPVAIKDNMCTKGMLTTCSSKILGNFQPMFTAEAVKNLEAAGAIVREQMDEFFQWLDGRDLIPRIQDIKDEAVNDLNLRIAKILKKTPMEEDDRQNLVHAVDTAAGKVVNKLIFGLRDSLNQEIFLECVAGLEKIYEE